MNLGTLLSIDVSIYYKFTRENAGFVNLCQIFLFTSRGNSMWNSGHFKLNMIMGYVTFILEHCIHIQIKNSHISSEKTPYH